MIYICKPQHVKLYINKGRKTAAQVKAETGCTAIINGGLFDMTKFAPIAQLRVDGKTLVNENWGTNYGYGWDKNVLAMTSNVSTYQNFIGCVCLIRNGKPVDKLACPSDMAYPAPRTAIGTFTDGRVWLYCTDVAMTPEQLRGIASAAGVRDAVMLDGGGSTQCIMPTGTISSARIVHNFICVWGDTAPEQPKEDKPMDKKIKVYLSPSSQPNNMYSYGNTNEQEQCRRIADFCRAALDRCGFEVKVGAAEPDYKGRTAESNSWRADYHIPIHTNAGGGHGALVMVYSNARKALGQPVYDALNDLCPWKSTYGVRIGNEHEIIYAAAPCIYIEAAFHDNIKEAVWIIDHVEDIGEAICKGFCKAVGVEYVQPNVKVETPAKEKSLTERVEALEAWARTHGF